MTFGAEAERYYRAVHTADRSAVEGEPEAQLTTPVSNLLTAVAREAGLGTLQLVRETRTGRTRPDFGVLLTRDGATRQKGFIELKAPKITANAPDWTGRNRTQWERMSVETEILVVCNGREARLFRDGTQIGAPAILPYDEPENWNEQSLVDLLDRFCELTPNPITDIADLTRRLAVRTRDLRDRIESLLQQDRSDPAAQEAKGSYRLWQQHIYPAASQRDFADGMAQVISYGMVLAALTPGEADVDGDGFLTVREARDFLRAVSPVLAAAFAPLLEKPVLREAVEVELGALETLVGAIQPDRIAQVDKRGDPWLHFYEDFLAEYDAEERRQAGVYYTPVAAVSAMTAMTGHLLVERFNKRMGFGDASVVTLDPATGTGTFPLAAIDRAIARAPEVRGAAGAAQAARNLADNMFAFELLPGPYAVAHLRLSQRLSELAGETTHANVILTDTLEAPDSQSIPPAEFWGDAQVLAEEQERANRVKARQRVTVVIGNPPYRRVASDLEGRGSGAWVLNGQVEGRGTEKSLFDDILAIGADNGLNVSAYSGLYNLYAYFWRWSLWKAFEAEGQADEPGIVTLITGSSWLDGPGFMGLRQIARELADEIWVLDLGGDNRGGNPEDNIFAIETPVAIVTLVRDGASDRETPAKIHYRRLRGLEEEKLAALKAIAERNDPFDGAWRTAPDGWRDPLLPPTGDASWEDMPLVTDLFPWQQPGCKFDRTWPVSPSPEILEARWTQFTRADPNEKPALFYTGSSGRNVDTKVKGFSKTLRKLKTGDESEPIRRYGLRSFDRQYFLKDPRLAKTESPSLWQSVSDRQIYLTSSLTNPLGPGPGLTATIDVPDLHFFRGSYGGKDIIPLYRDAEAKQPNLTEGLAATLGILLGIDPPSPEDIASYTYALLSPVAYQQRFAKALERPGLRVPITANAELWAEAVDEGRWLLWLHTYAERFVDSDAGRMRNVPPVEGLGWLREVVTMPQDRQDIDYDPDDHILAIGDGAVGGVRPDVWDFSVSGMQIVHKWLGYRTARGTGRATSSTSELDRIRPQEWADEWNDELLDLLRLLTLTLDRQDHLAELLGRVCDGPLISGADLPEPAADQRKPPPTIR